MKYLYRIYQLLICLPILLVASILTSIITVLGCMLGNGHFWGYYPGKLWSQLWIRLLLLPVKVEGREHLQKNQSYVFVANHQGSFDIFLIYGFLGRNFKWMMKKALRKVPLVGIACQYAHHILSTRAALPRYAPLTTRPARNYRKECHWLSSPKAPAPSQVTWVYSVEEPSCWQTSCSCPSVRSPSTAVSM